MDSAWIENGPVVIGGIGGSGTRLIADICSRAGIYLGQDLNESLDNLTYTLLFRRYRWFLKNRANSRRIQIGLSLFKKAVLKSSRFSLREQTFLYKAAVDTQLHYRKEDPRWVTDRLRNIFRSNADNPDHVGWGWKEPNSYLLLNHLREFFPGLKFIFTVRHGLDMAYSKNQKQMKNWGELILGEQDRIHHYTPEQSLKFWVAANRYAAEQGSVLGPQRFCIIKFEDLCLNPEATIDRLFRFLGVNVSEVTYQSVISLPEPPPSIGRYRSYDLGGFADEDLAGLKEFGYSAA